MTSRSSNSSRSSSPSERSRDRGKHHKHRTERYRSRSRSYTRDRSRSKSHSRSRSASYRSRSSSSSRHGWSKSRSRSRGHYGHNSRSGSRSSSYDRRRPRSRSRSGDSRGSNSDARSSPLIDRSKYHRDRSKRVSWRNTVCLVGEKTNDITFHYCELCDLPIVMYGRLLPCKHVLCFNCASALPDRKCNRCKKSIQTIDRCWVGGIFMCFESESCYRTYLSQRDLQAHIDHRHRTGANTSSTTEPVTNSQPPLDQGPNRPNSVDDHPVPPIANSIGFGPPSKATGLLPLPPQSSTGLLPPLSRPVCPPTSSFSLLQFTSPPPSTQPPPMDPMSIRMMNPSVPPPSISANPSFSAANALVALAAAVSHANMSARPENIFSRAPPRGITQFQPHRMNTPAFSIANQNPGWNQPPALNTLRLPGSLLPPNAGPAHQGRFPF